jgi:polar amino acid transport system substrate-binding protein
MRFARQVSSRVLFFADGIVYEDGTPEQLFDYPQRERTRQFIQQIHETTFLIETEHFDWYAMTAQMEQFCQRFNLLRQQIDNVLHVIEETLSILGTVPGLRLTLSYAEQDNVLQFDVSSPHTIDAEAFSADSDDIAVTILRNFSSAITIGGNQLHIIVK